MEFSKVNHIFPLENVLQINNTETGTTDREVSKN